jgi:hypothetical protein
MTEKNLMEKAMFQDARQFGMMNRPPGYAQCPSGWEYVERHSDRFLHGVVRYERPLTTHEMYSYEMTPVYETPELQAKALIEAKAACSEKTIEQVREKVKGTFREYREANMEGYGPAYVIQNEARRIYDAVRINALGKFTANELVVAMRKEVGYTDE